VTDGAAAAVDVYGLHPGWGAALDSLAETGPDAFIGRVRALESSDADGRQWPRSKPFDDATVAYMEFCR
jgi:hypothetical protein